MLFKEIKISVFQREFTLFIVNLFNGYIFFSYILCTYLILPILQLLGIEWYLSYKNICIKDNSPEKMVLKKYKIPC